MDICMKVRVEQTRRGSKLVCPKIYTHTRTEMKHKKHKKHKKHNISLYVIVQQRDT